MGLFDARAAQASARYRELVTPLLQPGEDLLGTLQATEKSSFSYKGWVVGVTADRLIMVPVDRKLNAKAPECSVRREDITASSVDGMGGGLKHFATGELGDIRFDTADRTWKLLIMGGGADRLVTGQEQTDGKALLLEFLASARAT